MSVKANRTLTMSFDVTVDLGDIELAEYDDYSTYLHDAGVRAMHEVRTETDVKMALASLKDITVSDVGSAYLNVNIHPESKAQMQAWQDAEQSQYETEQKAIDELGEILRIGGCVYSMDAEKLLNNEPFNDQVCRFVYSGGWDDKHVLEDTESYDKPTYQMVWQAADRLFSRSNDDHHVFVEGVEDKGVDSNGVRVYDFYYGS